LAANSIRITVRHATAPDDLEAFAIEKCARLQKFLRSEPRLEFTLEHAKVRWQGEVILHGSRHNERLVARDAHADPHGCVELLLEKLERQLEKGKERRKSHRGPSFSGDGKAPPESATPDEPSYEQIVRRDLKGDGAQGRKRK
jgi:ribosomal subunit interface protein